MIEPNPEITLSRFLSATSDATPQDSYSAPLYNSDPAAYDMTVLLQTYAEQQIESGRKDLFSFSNWDGGHSAFHHEGSTAVTLEYSTDNAEQVRAELAEIGLAYYEVPTRASRRDAVLFAFPVDNPLDLTETTRAATLIAKALGINGLTRNSYLYTYFFRFRAGEVRFSPGAIFTGQFLLDSIRVHTDIRLYIR